MFVFPSLYEGFGLPILEAMACGTPVACSNISSMPEVAGEAAVLFKPEEESSIALAVRSIMCATDLRKDLVVRGLERSRQFSWARTAAQTSAVIQSLVKH
jgi:glycosyltransferase involved in cell wall biosynthesis